MELKSALQTSSFTTLRSFNRTFMELKLSNTRLESFGSIVLIVPLWNWNDGGILKAADCSRF